jgi:hypothetical protein
MPFLSTFLADARIGARSFARSPGFVATAVVTLALGIGTSTALFSVVDAVLLRPLPYADPGSRVMVWSRWVGFDKTWVGEGELVDYRRSVRSFAQVAAWYSDQANLTGEGEPVRVGVAQVTPNLFSTLGTSLFLGRPFTEEEAAPPEGAPVVLVSHGLWTRHFGADPAILGRKILVDGLSRQIVGVAPRGVPAPTDAGKTPSLCRLFVPLPVNGRSRSGQPQVVRRRRASCWRHRRPGERRASARGQLGRGRHHPQGRPVPALRGLREGGDHGRRAPALLLLGTATGLLLLITCSNVAGLLSPAPKAVSARWPCAPASAPRPAARAQLLAEG